MEFIAYSKTEKQVAQAGAYVLGKIVNVILGILLLIMLLVSGWFMKIYLVSGLLGSAQALYAITFASAAFVIFLTCIAGIYGIVKGKYRTLFFSFILYILGVIVLLGLAFYLKNVAADLTGSTTNCRGLSGRPSSCASNALWFLEVASYFLFWPIVVLGVASFMALYGQLHRWWTPAKQQQH